MAVDFFLKIDGIDGESKDDKHGKEIDVLAWSWGISQAGQHHRGGGGGAGKADFQDLSVTCFLEESTSPLMVACATGRHIPKAWLVSRKAGDKPMEFIKAEFQDILVTSVNLGGSGGETNLTANVTLNFAKVKWDYHKQKKDGSPEAAKTFHYDIEANKKL